MATVSIVKIKVRRGSDAERKTVTFDVGELGFVTDADARRLYIGDGVTLGGVPTSMYFYSGSITQAAAGTSVALAKAQIGDLIFNTDNSQLFILSGINVGSGFPDYTNPNAYQSIAPATDNTTVVYNGAGALSVNTNGVSAVHIAQDVLDTISGGFRRPSPTGSFKISTDNTSIKINLSNQLYVDPYSTDWASNAGIHKTRPGTPGILWIDPSADNALKIS